LLLLLPDRLYSEDAVTAMAGARADLAVDIPARMLGWVYDPPEEATEGARPIEPGVKVGPAEALSRRKVEIPDARDAGRVLAGGGRVDAGAFGAFGRKANGGAGRVGSTTGAG
jgi:hypothetical protein